MHKQKMHSFLLITYKDLFHLKFHLYDLFLNIFNYLILLASDSRSYDNYFPFPNRLIIYCNFLTRKLPAGTKEQHRKQR